MDLDDVLEDLLRGARRAMRDRARQRRDARRERWLPRFALVAGTVWAATLGLAALTLGLVVDGGFGLAGAVGLGALAAFGVPLAVWGGLQVRREGRVRRTAREAEAHLARLPREVREDWRRMEQARALVGELCEEGWVSADAVAELDEHVARLRRALDVDRRSRELGGRASSRLAGQVADLADLLVALADEGVDQQAELVAASTAPATLVQARDRMVALRAARREVEDLDRPRGTPSTG